MWWENWVHTVPLRLRSVFQREHADAELDEELRDHVERQTQENVGRGMSIEEARRAALIAIGGLEQRKQQCREVRGIRFIDDLLKDICFAVRQLRRTPIFTITAILALALGISSSSTIFAFVDAALIRPLPYRQPSRLVALYERLPVGERYHLSYPDYVAWKSQNRVFRSLDVYRPERLTLRTHTGVEEVPGASVSDGFFRTLGVSPLLGRDFRQGEDSASAARTIILSYNTWQHQFGASKTIVGHTLEIDDDTYLVIGVLPPDFAFPPAGPAGYWRTIHGLCAGNRFCYPYYGVARLKSGVSVPAAAADLSTIARQIASAFPASNRDRSAAVLSLTYAILGNIRPTLTALLGGAILLLLIGYVNISSLLIVRAESRRGEVAVRAALGASRTRLIRQFAVEGSVLASIGGLLGLVAAFCSIRLLLRLVPEQRLNSMPYLRELSLGWHLIMVFLLEVILGVVLFTLAPSVQLGLAQIQTRLSAARHSIVDKGWKGIGGNLIVAELIITVILMTSAGLLTKSFYRLLHSDIGFSPKHLVVLHISSQDNMSAARQTAIGREIAAVTAHLPGVTSVGVSGTLPVSDGESFKAAFAHFRVFGRYYPGVGDEALDLSAGVGYFETLKARLIEGRYFAESDDDSEPLVGIINETMAKQDFPGRDPLGERLIDQYDPDRSIEIVGVVGDLKNGPLGAEPTPAVYRPFGQVPSSDFYLTVRASNAPRADIPSILSAIHRTEPMLIADEADTMLNRIDSSQEAYLHRVAAFLVGGFALLALIMGAIGLYGVIAYSVSRRIREIGLRMALGAQRITIYQLIMQEAFRLASIGAAAGILCSFVAARLMSSILFGVRPWDPSTMTGVVAVLLTVTVLASYFPARRAASIHPTEALRTE